MTATIDITPTPRILRTLGDIPFDAWQCLAELSDNSLVSFRKRARLGQPVANARVDIHWSNESTPAFDRETDLKRALLFISAKPFSKTANDIHILLLLFAQHKPIPPSDKKNLQNALSRCGATPNIFGER